MLTDRKLLELVYEAASCYIPTEELDEEQLEKLDNISYRWCNCVACRRPFKMQGKTIVPQCAGHSDKRGLKICVSRSVLREGISSCLSIFLLNLIIICLHEIVHILFQEFDEDQTINKTWKWLRENRWVASAEESERLGRKQFYQELEK